MKRLISVIIIIPILFSVFTGIDLTALANNSFPDYYVNDFIYAESYEKQHTSKDKKWTYCIVKDRNGNGTKYAAINSYIESFSATVITLPKKVDDLEVKYIAPSREFRSVEEFRVEKGHKYFSAKDGVLFNKKKTKLVLYPRAKSGSYKIPNTVKVIDFRAFKSCKALTGKMIIPDSVEKICDSAFAYTGITSVKIPKSVKSIGETAFYYCSGLKSVFVPKTVKKIGSKAFGLYYLGDYYNESATVKNFVLMGYKGSAAEKYCKKMAKSGNNDGTYKIKFKAVDIKTPKVSYKIGKGKIKVKYSKVKKAQGFQVKYTKGNSTKTATFKTAKSATKSIKKLKKGKYTVKTRAYYKLDGQNIYSEWTKNKILKVK